MLVTGNKFGALLLTVFVLKLGAGYERFTKRRAASAVQDGLVGLAKHAYRSIGHERHRDRRPECPPHSGAVKKNCVATGSDLLHARVQPDIEVVCLKFINDLELSRSSEVRLPLLWLALHRPDQRVACGKSAA
jgi:hypothetical protein